MSAAQDNDHHHYHYCKKLVWSPQWEGALHSINHTLVADPPPPLQLHCFDFPFLQTHAPHIIIICLTTRITRHYRILCARPEEYTSSVYLPTAKLAWIRQFKVSITPPPPHCKCTLFKLFSDATLMGNCDANSAQKTMSMQRGDWKKNGKRKKSKRWYRERAITKKESRKWKGLSHSLPSLFSLGTINYIFAQAVGKFRCKLKNETENKTHAASALTMQTMCILDLFTTCITTSSPFPSFSLLLHWESALNGD